MIVIVIIKIIIHNNSIIILDEAQRAPPRSTLIFGECSSIKGIYIYIYIYYVYIYIYIVLTGELDVGESRGYFTKPQGRKEPHIW